MKISYNWLKEFVDLKRYPALRLADFLTMNFAEIDGMETVSDDTIFDLKILPDRMSDCLSHYGVARELSALLKLKIKNKKLKIKESKKEKIEDILKVENKEPAICKRYVSRVIKNVKIEPSPKWLAQKLEALDQKSINNIVDATNYVMLELGQPLHAFDLDKLSKIVIRKAHKGEKIITLDNQEVELSEDILVIASEAKQSTLSSKLQIPNSILAIAGVKGGEKAEIDENTRNIVLESANFDAGAIRKSSRLTGIKTESSVRFAADLDPNLAGIAIERLASLIAKIAGGEIASGKIDIYPRKIISQKVAVSVDDANSLLGQKISEKEIADILERLNFKAQKISQTKELTRLAKKFIGKPYKYGASTSQDAPQCFDCSSFVQYLYWQIGISIPRISVEQFLFAKPISKEHLKVGDLLFSKGGKPYFYKETPRGVGHIGIYIGANKVIHASGKKQKVILEDIKVFTKKDFRGFGRVADLRDDVLIAEIPTYRRDIGLKADIIEEIGRFHGYQNLKSRLPQSILIPSKRNDELYFENISKNVLVAAGFAETYNYSFIGEKDLRYCNFNSENILALANYLSDDRKYLRPSLLAGFLNNMKENLKYFKDARIFEIGRVFGAKPTFVPPSPRLWRASKTMAGEEKFLGGAVVFKNTLKSSAANEFYEIKASVDSLLSKLGLSDFWYDDFKAQADESEKSIWHPMRSAEIKIGNEKIGFLGEISKQILQNYDIDGRVAAFEIDFEKLARLASEEVVYRPISKYPAMERDLAIIVPLDARVDDVLNILENAGGHLLVDTDLFDIYEGDNISEGMKSLAFHLVFQSPQKTLSDEEVEKIMNNIFLVLSQKGWEVRTS